MSIYRYAGATLALAGFHAKQQRDYGRAHDCYECGDCQMLVAYKFSNWLRAQS